MGEPKLILVTGATGYVGGRLVPRLLAAGYRVRCLVRDSARLQGRAWLNEVELAHADMLQPRSLVAAMRDVYAAYYLVHSLGGGSDFSERDLKAARNCAEAAKAAGVNRIIYLGGLGDPQANLSPHLRSRQETVVSRSQPDLQRPDSANRPGSAGLISVAGLVWEGCPVK